MRFSVTMVVNDGERQVGIGLGKAQEIPEVMILKTYWKKLLLI